MDIEKIAKAICSQSHSPDIAWANEQGRFMDQARAVARVVECPTGGTILSRDDRQILSIRLDGATEAICAGAEGIDKIVAYDECGQSSSVPWVAVYRGDQIIFRAPAHMVSIAYSWDLA